MRNKKPGVPSLFFNQSFPTKILEAHYGRSPDSKAFSVYLPTLEKSSGLLNGLLSYSCGDSSGITPDSLLINSINMEYEPLCFKELYKVTYYGLQLQIHSFISEIAS